jgi:DNA mismatch repair protein MutL
VSEQQAHHFDNPAPFVQSDETQVSDTALRTVDIITIEQGACVFNDENQLYCSHFKYALADDWLAQIKEQGSLEGKALLLPVRVNVSKQDIELLATQQSWFTLLGFELLIEKQFVMVKKLPVCLYLLDVSTAVDALLDGCKAQLESIDQWLAWQVNVIPTRFYASKAFAVQQTRLQNNAQTIERLREKAVKIDLKSYLAQFN